MSDSSRRAWALGLALFALGAVVKTVEIVVLADRRLLDWEHATPLAPLLLLGADALAGAVFGALAWAALAALACARAHSAPPAYAFHVLLVPRPSPVGELHLFQIVGAVQPVDGGDVGGRRGAGTLSPPRARSFKAFRRLRPRDGRARRGAAIS